ncbi:sensor histidine kinase [Cellulomonas sp. URHD0024]|uniref:sensor histidine kinase n=1 Tax=Cellulomonas sp. URHD0024 TaxID=1302620 RepID=UPI0003FA726D|nr:histidine kinase [Cellulomonas sp. URHD0024]
MITALRRLWAAPRSPGAPARVWRDWWLVGILLVLSAVELATRAIVWLPVSIPMALLAIGALLFRRTRPLLAVGVAYGAVLAVNIASWSRFDDSIGFYTTTSILVLSYALCRWGSGREVTLGMVLIVLTGVAGVSAHYTTIGETVGEAVFFLFPCVLGGVVRLASTARLRETDQVKLREREMLARELHDTVAHHVSAIAIRAQAGRVVAASDPTAALDALGVIEAEATRALSEMRLMVRTLREGDEVDLAPQRGVDDIERLAFGSVPPVAVSLRGPLDDLRPTVGAAVYRLAQESITNAVRHARHATRITVDVTGSDDTVRLVVTDDGEPHVTGRGWTGYGLIGMTERAALLGGTLAAGPGAERGWTVDAVLPKSGASR